ncbi:hypothetical protein V8C44DRAFT_238255 [Trichoderma aethiopicum]
MLQKMREQSISLVWRARKFTLAEGGRRLLLTRSPDLGFSLQAALAPSPRSYPQYQDEESVSGQRRFRAAVGSGTKNCQSGQFDLAQLFLCSSCKKP